MCIDVGASTNTLAQWLRRWPTEPMVSARVGSNPVGAAVALQSEQRVLRYQLCPCSNCHRSHFGSRYKVS